MARWLSLTFDEVSPSQFIPLLETLGMNKKFDLYMLDNTIHLLESQKDLPKDFFLDVNFSANLFYDDSFVNKLQEFSGQKAWLKNYLVIEITENIMMADIEKAATNIQKIKELGFKIAIDDFGTGFSSLAYLKYFPIDF